MEISKYLALQKEKIKQKISFPELDESVQAVTGRIISSIKGQLDSKEMQLGDDG